ncbi:inositol monophosphatase [Pseudactinotalea sp. HY160]|uniref:inositol monophosphatase family protein n=1 Tax=Pseudactinotalea sp. HY160 TaxID=2654490 RepID=UPI00351B999E
MPIDILAVMKHAADTVIMPRWRSLSDDQVEEKNPGDLVTVADRESEQVITAELRSAHPKAMILGEEAYAADPGILEDFQRAEHAFTVDPIDGTSNFVHGSRDFAVMVAELRAGDVVRSWIWQPAHGVAYEAEAGAGATRNGAVLPRRELDPDTATWRGATARRGLLARDHVPLAQLREAAWCCGVDYPHVATGDLDYLVYSKVWPWDHAPGSLLVREIGGRSIRKDGSSYSPAAPIGRWLLAGADASAPTALSYLEADLTEEN